MKKISLLILSVFFLAACGGSGGTTALSDGEQELMIVSPEDSQSIVQSDFEGFTEDFSYNYFPDGIPEEGTRSISQTSKATSLTSIQDLPNQMLTQQILEPNLTIQLPKPPTIITTPPPSTDVPKRATQEALRLDATQLRDGKSVVVFERLIAGEEDKTEIVARTYDVTGAIVVADKVVSDAANAAHAIDPTFQAKFPGLTEPKCNSWRNPSVEFVRNDADPSKDRILIAYEAHCTAKVVFPDRDQFFVGPNQQVYDLDKTHPREQKFIVVKAVRKAGDLQNLAAGDVDPLKEPRATGVLSASYLFNDAGANGKVLKDDTSIYKWSSSRSPHLAKDKAGNVLLTYQTNRKVNGCLSNRVNKPEDVQATWYDEIYSIDAQLIAQNRGPVRVVFRSLHTGADGQETPKDLCRKLEKNEVESAFEPVSAFNQAAAQDAGFAVIFSVENGKVSEHHDHAPLLDKTLADRFLPELANAIPALPVAQQTSFTSLAQLGQVDMSLAPKVHNDEYKHVESDLSFVPAFDVFAAAHDADGEIHVFLLENNAALLPVNNEARVQQAENFPEGDLQDVITSRGDEGKTSAFRPQISSVLQEERGESFINKLGIAYHQKRADGEWDALQNYFRFAPTEDENVLALGFERASADAFNVSNQAAAPRAGLQHSFGPVPLLSLTDDFGTGEANQRFRTFWVGLPQQAEGYIYDLYAPEGVPPIAAFTVTDAAANNYTWSSDELSGERRLNQLDAAHAFVLNLADADSVDPDSAGGLQFTWKIRNSDNSYNWQGAGNNANNRNNPIIAYDTYIISLTVKDQDGLTGTTSFNLVLEQNQVPQVTQVGVVNADAETPLDANNPPLFALGSEIQLRATASDAADAANATRPEDLTFAWTVTLNNNRLQLPISPDSHVQTIPLNAAGLYQVSVVARDADGGASPAFVRSFNVNRLDVLSFTSNAIGNRISLTPATVQGGMPTGTVQLRWTTQLADRVELFKMEFDEDGQMQAEEPLGIANLPLNIAVAEAAQQITMDRHTRYILRAFRAGAAAPAESTLEVSFSNPTVTALTSPQAAQGQIRLNLVDAQAYGETRLDWVLRDASQIVSLAQEVAGQQPVLFGYRAQAGQDQEAAFPLPRFANNRLEGESFVRPTANSNLRLTVQNPDGVPGNRTLPVLFNAPVVNSFSVVEAEGFPESAIHLSWQTHNATSVSVKLIRNGQPLEIAQLVNNPAQVFVANRFEVSLPNFAVDAQAQLRIDIAGPGGSISSQAVNINLLAINLRINSFSANPELIDLDPATVAGHPAPDTVYGITRLRWQTEHADAVQLFKVVGGAAPVLVPASELLDNGGQDQAARPLPINFAVADNGIRVRVNQDTTFLLRAGSVVAGVPHTLDSQVPVSFNAHSKTFTAPATVNYNNQTRNGTVALTWTSSNIKQVSITAFECLDAQCVGRQNPRVIVDGANATLALNQAVPINDTISRRTAYVAAFTQLSGVAVNIEQIVNFAAPSIQDFAANPATLDFAANQTTAQTQLIWHTQNTSRVELTANNVAVNLVDAAPDAQGVGTVQQQIGVATHYVLTALNPDGASITREIDVTFNAASLTLADVVSSEGEAELYHGRGARVSWNNIRNVASMTLYLANAAGDRVAGNPTRAFANLQAVNTPPWDFTLPNPAQPSVNYRIRAELANPNGAQPVVVLGNVFTVSSRPVATITSFAVNPSEIIDLVEEAGQVVGHSTLEWQTTGAAAEQPVTALEQKAGAAAYQALAGVNVANLQANDSVQLTIPANINQGYRYRLTVQNRFNDTVQRETSIPPVASLLHFATPSVPSFNIAEGEAFPSRNITVSWQTRTATSVDVVLVRGAQQTILLTDNTFATASVSNARAVPLPEFAEDNVQAQLKLVARGPAGTTDSALVPITLRQVPVSGVFRFCAPDSNAVCGINSAVNFDANAFQATVELQWVVNPVTTARVDHICVGARPANDGTCVDARINLPPGANFVDQGNGNGTGGTSVQINSAKQYWLVTQAVGEQVLTVYDSPVNVGFNAPSIATFSAARNVLNQNLQTNLSWTGVQNASAISVEVVGAQNVAGLPFNANENAQFMPNGSQLISSADVGNIQLRITATGPGGNITRDVQLTVNQVPAELNIITPNADLDLFAPTKLAIQWNAAPEEQLQAGDVRKVDQYAICYDVYKSDAQGARGDRLANVGAPCPDLTTSAFVSINDFPANIEYVDAAATPQYTHVFMMDPKLNDPTNPQRAAFLRYEIGVIAIDSNDQLLGLSKSTRTVLTDDSVEAWYKFAENFTAGQVCAGGAAGYTICDSGRFAHHARPVGGPAWANPGILLNPQDQRTQWAVINGRFSNISEFAVEAVATPNIVENSNRYVFAMGDPNAAAEDDWINSLFFNRLRQILRHAGGTLIQIARTVLQINQSYHSVYICEQGGSANLYLDGQLDTVPVVCPNVAIPDAARFGFIGASHRSAASPATYKPFSGTIEDLAIYSRPLTEEEISNHALAR